MGSRPLLPLALLVGAVAPAPARAQDPPVPPAQPVPGAAPSDPTAQTGTPAVSTASRAATRLTLAVKPAAERSGRSAFALAGALTRTDGAKASCRGARVALQVRHAGKTVFRRKARLTSRCTYAATYATALRGRITVTARFEGSEALQRSKPARQTLRVG